MIQPSVVYTIAEAAEHMRLPYRVVRDAVFADRWPHIKVSQRRRLMTGEDIQASLDLMRQGPSLTQAADEAARKRRVQALLGAA